MSYTFFLPMKRPPTVTAQMKRSRVSGGKVVFYPPESLVAARSVFESALAPHRPEKPIQGAVRLVTKWCWTPTKGHVSGEYKTTRPDTDNMIKLFKDVMTDLGYWQDDAQVASEITEKFWADPSGIFVSVDLCTAQGGVYMTPCAVDWFRVE